MADHAHGRPVVTPPLNHELSDADPSPVLKFLAFLVVITAVIAGFVVFFYNYLERREAAEKTARYPMSLVGGERPVPPPPRLQNYPFQDIKQLRQNDKPLLERYEWIDKGAGTVRIPVNRAIDLLAERRLRQVRSHPARRHRERPEARAARPRRRADRRRRPATRAAGSRRRRIRRSRSRRNLAPRSRLRAPGRVWPPAATMKRTV